MDSTSANPRRLLLGLLSTLLLLSCALIATCRGLRAQTPVNGWSKAEWGPVVPHDKFPADCGICHVPERWDILKEGFSFDHEKETGYALEGAHQEAACLRCHNDLGPVEAYVSRGCAGCHLDVHQGKLGIRCTECHTQENWRPDGLIAEHARTSFPLVGSHIAVACELCHVRAPTGDYSDAPTQCAACHLDEAQAVTFPDHVATGWTSGCDRCHFPTVWGAGGFNHGWFPLTGGHDLACNTCHNTGGVPGPLPTDCYACHQDDYATAPNHSAFSTNCQQCHNINRWQGAVFNHNFFPLTKGHANLACIACHTSGTVGPIPSDCFSCHKDDYDTAPNHAGFSTNCTQCHNTTQWQGAIFNHNFFPLTNGHANLACTDCHTSGNTGPIPSDCYSCHQDDYATAPNHSTFSHSCQQCHTTKQWQGATFNHRFPRTGPHNVSCATCHPTGDSTYTCFACHEHSQSRMDDRHRGVRNYRYESTACVSCHPSGRGD